MSSSKILSGWMLSLSIAILGCTARANNENDRSMTQSLSSTDESQLQTATFGAGCFWCVEAPFLEIKGVEKVVSGYMGGTTPNPSYEEVCTGRTGHAEVCQLSYNPNIISYDELLEIFWTIHDPTQLNRQGQDIGTQYRSVIFYHNEEQKSKAQTYKERLIKANAYDAPIVTEISPVSTFYEAEDYHQNYYNMNPNQPFCHFVVRPKVEKVRQVFRDKLKD